MVDMTVSGDPTAAMAQRPEKTEDERRLVVARNRIDSRDLFSGTREITIAHGDGVYRLRLTSQNKLILTK
jgi:hemin uptake protein HemP